MEYQYKDAEIGSFSPTFRWIGDIVLQIVTTLSSAYTVFNAIICRLIIHKIKVLFLIWKCLQEIHSLISFIGQRQTSNNFLHACILPENNVSDCLSDFVSFYGSLDDVVPWSMGKCSRLYDKDLQLRKRYLFERFCCHHRTYDNNFRKRFRCYNWVILKDSFINLKECGILFCVFYLISKKVKNPTIWGSIFGIFAKSIGNSLSIITPYCQLQNIS